MKTHPHPLSPAKLKQGPARLPVRIEARSRKIRYAPFPGDRLAIEAALPEHSWN